MEAKDPCENPEIVPLDDFVNARASLSPRTRLAEVRTRAHRFRARMLAEGKARYFRTFDLVRVPYPTKYGLLDAFTRPTPLMHILNRVFIVQYDSAAGLKTLLFSPSDVVGNRETPFFKRMSASLGPTRGALENTLAPQLGTVERALEEAGISPEEVDYISYDHLHTQDLRKWLGTFGSKGYFPNAKLLVMQPEWASTHALLPPQAEWYCPGGVEGIPADRVVQLDRDVRLGEGVALIATPGHTEGNHSLVVHTDEGLFVTSENGVCADSYAPLASQIPGVRRYAEASGMEVILNGNTRERGLDQYISMVKEKTIAGPSLRDPRFFNFYPSSEMSPFPLFPWAAPTFRFGALSFGRVQDQPNDPLREPNEPTASVLGEFGRTIVPSLGRSEPTRS